MSAPTGGPKDGFADEPVRGQASVPAGMKIVPQRAEPPAPDETGDPDEDTQPIPLPPAPATGRATVRGAAAPPRWPLDQVTRLLPSQRTAGRPEEAATAVLLAPPPPPPTAAPAVPADPAPPRRTARRVVPKPKWVVAAVLIFVFVSLLLVEAYANARFTPDQEREPGAATVVPEQILNGGPIINAVPGQDARSYRLPAKTIALTFDDGPDPRWTPQVMATLDRYRAKGTFFVIGSQVVRHPDLAKDLVGKGHELGVHTFTHPDVAALPDWRRRMEYSQTQLALAEAAGVRTSLLRFPYSSRADSIDDTAWDLVAQAGALGYVTVVNDLDSRDWERPGVPAIVMYSLTFTVLLGPGQGADRRPHRAGPSGTRRRRPDRRCAGTPAAACRCPRRPPRARRALASWNLRISAGRTWGSPGRSCRPARRGWWA